MMRKTDDFVLVSQLTVASAAAAAVTAAGKSRRERVRRACEFNQQLKQHLTLSGKGKMRREKENFVILLLLSSSSFLPLQP